MAVQNITRLYKADRVTARETVQENVEREREKENDSEREGQHHKTSITLLPEAEYVFINLFCFVKYANAKIIAPQAKLFWRYVTVVTRSAQRRRRNSF